MEKKKARVERMWEEYHSSNRRPNEGQKFGVRRDWFVLPVYSF